MLSARAVDQDGETVHGILTALLFLKLEEYVEQIVKLSGNNLWSESGIITGPDLRLTINEGMR